MSRVVSPSYCVYVYNLWFVSMCLCCIQSNKSYVVVVVGVIHVYMRINTKLIEISHVILKPSVERGRLV